jgi:hypothetical protein
MGVCRWGSEMIVRMMSRFPSTVTRYMDRNSPKRRDCRSESSVSPKRITFLGPVWFLFSMGLLGLHRRRVKRNTKFTVNRDSPVLLNIYYLNQENSSSR